MTVMSTISDWELQWIWWGIGVYLTLKCIHAFLEMRTAYYEMRRSCVELQLAELRASKPDSSIDD